MDRPNLLVIMSDQHNPRMMGHAGSPEVETPNLDRLAKSGVACTRAYSAGPLCVPSRMAFLTGRHPSDLRVWTNRCILDSSTPTFAHQLGLAGWETILCGRMHFCGPDQHHGFRHRLVGDPSGAMEGRIEDMFDGAWSLHGCGQNYRSHRDDAAGAGRTAYMAYDEDVASGAGAALCERASRPGDDRPFCMVVGFMLPHNPYVCPRDLFERYMDACLPIDPSPPRGSEHPAIQAFRQRRGTERITPEQARRALAAYLGLTTLLDRNVGRILDTLRETGLADNTAVAYTSDHGDLAGEHGLWWKDCFYEGSVRVPLLWSWPGHFAADRTVNEVVSLLDIGPTLADLAGADPLPGVRGQSLRPLLEAASGATGRDTAWAEIYPAGLGPARMLRTGRWKLNVYHGYEQPQLFDLDADPGETRDLAADAAFADIRNETMDRALRDWSGADIERRIADREAEHALLEAWAGLVPPGRSERWTQAAGQNRREPA